MITFSESQQKIVDRLKTERMLQAEFEQYAKEHGYIISTTNIIEQIRAEIEAIDVTMGIKDYPFIPKAKVLNVIDKYTKGE